MLHVMSCQKLSCRFHVADVVSCCCMKRTSKQPYPDDDIELVHLERTSSSVKEHESLMGITTPTNRLNSLEPSSPYLRMVWILD